MPQIKRSSIEEIRSRVNIVDVVEPHAHLERKGNRWWGLSPFANEKTPSFSVTPDNGLYYCFSTSQGGDIFRFVQEVERLTFYEAVEVIANRFNVKIEYEEGGTGASSENRSIRREMEEMHTLAEDYYHSCFKADHPQAQQMREYWTQQRGFPPELADEFKIGFAPSDGGKLLKQCLDKGFSTEAIIQCGLFYARDNESDPNRCRPRFRGRLMIPIRDIQDRTIAFTARQTELTPEDDPPGKYINSPETALFKKGSVLFNLNRVRKETKREDPILMVEGQLDALRCWEKGLKNAIAPQGTAVTDTQMKLLARYTYRVESLLDGDEAGQKAATRAAAMAVKAGLEIRYLPLPDGEDPDDLLRTQGTEALESLRKTSLTMVEFLLKRFLPNGFRSTVKERSEGFRQLFEVIAEAPSAMERSQYLEELARKAGVEEHLVQEEYNQFSYYRRKQDTSQILNKNAIATSKKLTTATYELLLLILHDSTLAAKVSEAIDPQWIDKNNLNGKLLDRILGEIREGDWRGQETVHELLENDEERNCIQSIVGKGIDFETTHEQANYCIRKLFNEHFTERRNELRNQLSNINPDDTGTLRQMYQQLKEIDTILRQPPSIDES